tara:strand:- start:38 stop:967 length:930 start_codon:yes stop_codon:yes gene_type:complete
MDNIFLVGEENINDENYINENNIIDRKCDLVQGENNLKGIYDINNLINKEIKRENILLSSKDLEKEFEKNHDSKTLRFDLTLNSAGGINYKRNVIGFRLNECIFTSPIFNITKPNNIIKYRLDSNDQPSITIPPGFYTINSLLNDINNNNNNKFELAFISTTELINLTNNSASTLSINTSQNSLMYNLGFHNTIENIPQLESSENTIPSDTHPSLNIGTYLDIVVDEIPYGACKQNSKGLNIVHRLPIRPDTGSSIVYYSSNFIDHKYQHLFSPINLGQLTIHLFMDGSELKLDNLVISFEFELVILNK